MYESQDYLFFCFIYFILENIPNPKIVLCDITMESNSNQDNQQVLKTLHAVTKVAEILSKTHDLNTALPKVLKYLGEAANASRVYIYKNLGAEDDDICVRQIFEWVADSSITQIESKDVLMVKNGYKRWVEQLTQKNVISGLVSEFPESEQKMLLANNIKAICVVPIFLDDCFYGFIGFDDCETSRKWGAVEIEPLRSAANIFGAYLKLNKSESALKESEDLYKSIYYNMSIGLYRTTPDGQILMANPALLKKLGFDSFEELAKYNIKDGDFQKNYNRQDFIDKIKKEGTIQGYETTWNKKDGSIIHIRESSRIVKDDKGNILYYEGTIEDITELKLAEEHMIKTQKLESVGLLAGGIAHDFNNLLTGILGNIALAKSEVDTVHEAFVCLNEAEIATLHAKDLTNQLLTFSSGGKPILVSTHIRDLIVRSTNMIIKNGNIQPIYKIDDDLKPAEIDKAQFRQVLYNIVINAEQSMPNGGVIKVHADNCCLSDDQIPNLKAGDYLKITFTDEGVGIPPNILPKVFDPYYTTKQSGSGLGLATVFSIIRKHQGYVTIDSILGEGTTVTFYLPASKSLKIDEPEKIKKQPIPSNNKGRILVMDDEDFIRVLAERVLTKAGFEVESVEDGEQALMRYEYAFIQNKSYDVVVLDLTIPEGMGGKETMERLRHFDPDIKSIVCSGYSNDPVMSFYKQYGFDTVVAKPYRPADLVNAVNSLLGYKSNVSD